MKIPSVVSRTYLIFGQNAFNSQNDSVLFFAKEIKNYFNDGIQLYEVIRNLMEELQRRAKKVTSTNYNEKLIKPTFLTFT